MKTSITQIYIHVWYTSLASFCQSRAVKKNYSQCLLLLVSCSPLPFRLCFSSKASLNFNPNADIDHAHIFIHRHQDHQHVHVAMCLMSHVIQRSAPFLFIRLFCCWFVGLYFASFILIQATLHFKSNFLGLMKKLWLKAIVISIVLVQLNEFPSIFQKVQHAPSRHQKTTSNLLRIYLKGILKFNEIWSLEGATMYTVHIPRTELIGGMPNLLVLCNFLRKLRVSDK